MEWERRQLNKHICTFIQHHKADVEDDDAQCTLHVAVNLSVTLTVAPEGQHKYKSRNTTHKPQWKFRRNGSEQCSGPRGRTD